MRDGNYTRISPLDLSKQEVSSLVQVNTLLEFLQENHPSTLDSLFVTSASAYELSTLAPHKLTSLFIEEQYNALQIGKSNEEFTGSVKDKIPQGVKIEFAEYAANLADRTIEAIAIAVIVIFGLQLLINLTLVLLLVIRLNVKVEEIQSTDVWM